MSRIYVDFDGVMFTNKRALNKVANRCTKLVQKSLRLSNFNDAESVNKLMYKNVGHTARGLRCFNFDITNSEFNDAVYKNMVLPSLEKSDQMLMAKWFNKFKRLELQGIEVVIYTDAPGNWVFNVLDELNMELSRDVMVISSEDVGSLKCEVNSYLMLTPGFLIDDNHINVETALSVDDWSAIVYHNQEIMY